MAMFLVIQKRIIMENVALTQRPLSIFTQEQYLEIAFEVFITDRKSEGLSPKTISYYREKLSKFIKYCTDQEIKYISQITPDTIRSYLLYMSEVRHNNKGGVHMAFRCIRTFLYWYEREYEPENWKNPIKKVKPPKQSQEIIEPASLESIAAMIDTCDVHTFLGCRDAAIQYLLLDTGCRASEFLSINLVDVDAFGVITLHPNNTKTGKERKVYLGKKSRKILRKYLSFRSDNNPALWITNEQERLTYVGLREIIRRHAKKANVKPPALHGYRRAFALNMLRNDCDIFSLQKIMGHSTLNVLRRYLAQNDDDIKNAHDKASPVDKSF
jgi:integrase/recombinase XerD